MSIEARTTQIFKETGGKSILDELGYKFLNPTFWFVISLISFIGALITDSDKPGLIKFATVIGCLSVVLQLLGNNVKGSGSLLGF